MALGLYLMLPFRGQLSSGILTLLLMTGLRKQAHLSGLGRMGQRHLSALIEEGYDVVAIDPRSPVLRKNDNLAQWEKSGRVRWGADPSQEIFDVAIFSGSISP